jgi:DNA-binding beta-propeller fold protein YncE
MVMAEALTRIDFSSPRTMRLRHSTHVPCAGVNHMDFTADGRDAVASCEFSAKLLWINISKRMVERTLTLGKPLGAPVTPPGPGYSMPQDVRLSANGKIFYVADMAANGIWLIDAHRFRVIRFIHTGAGTHGFLVSRNGRARSRCSTSPPTNWCTSGGSPVAAHRTWAASLPTAR